MGCHITTSENVIFKLLGDAKHKQFKNVQSLVRTPTQYTGLVPTAKIWIAIDNYCTVPDVSIQIIRKEYFYTKYTMAIIIEWSTIIILLFFY